MTLFAATPLVSSAFDSSYNQYDSSTQTKQYSPDWGCSYPESENIESVQVTHYGASTLRAKLKGWGETSTTYFSDAEKTLMQETTIYTNDKKQLCIFHDG